MKYLLSTVLITSLLFISCSPTDQLQQTPEERHQALLDHSELITPELLRSHLEIIAHDSLKGRETGTEGERIAAQYLIDQYERMGVSPKGTDGYRQPFMLNAERVDSLVYRTYSVQNGDTTLVSHSLESSDSMADYMRIFGGSEPLNGDVVFGGFGVDDPERDVHQTDTEKMRGNWVVIFEDMPTVVDGDTLINPEISNNQRIGNLLGNVEASGVLLISDTDADTYEEIASINSDLITKPENMRLQYLDDSGSASQAGFPRLLAQISPDMAVEFLGLDSTSDLDAYRDELVSDLTGFEPYTTPYHIGYEPYEGTVEVESKNIIAYIEGDDPELKDEVHVLVAHYDHIGITQPDDRGDQINNGADDNGSGTVALLTIAEALQNAKESGQPLDRSVLFVHVSAEEKGLLGSRYYSDHPVVPIEQTVAAFNADMIGRSDPENIEAGDTDYVYLIGGEIISSGLDSLVQQSNDETVNMRLDRKYNDLSDPNQFYRRSDHWNFGRLDIPFVFFFTGVHEDYHAPGDEVHKIDFEKLSRITRLIYASTVNVANYDGRPEVDNEEFIEITRGGR